MPTKKSQTTDETDRELLNHIKDLGLGNVDDYREWCAQNGFSSKLKKNWKHRCRESSFMRRSILENHLVRKRREKRKPIDVIQAVCIGELGEEDVTQPHLLRLCQLLHTSGGQKHERQVNREDLARLLTHLHRRRAKFFDGAPVVTSLGRIPGNTYVEALAMIAAHSSAWLRPVEEWKPHSRSPSRQFASLLRHLLVKFDDVPSFLDSVWFAGQTAQAAEQRKWYLHVGKGQSIRYCKLPISLTKKMAHCFMHAPNDLTVAQALRWAQVLGLGGDARLARAIFGTRLVEHFEHDDFWTSVIRWFVRHSMLDRFHVGPIVDYLYNQRFVPEYHPVTGYQGSATPPQPALTMKDRSPAILLERVNEWHRSLTSEIKQNVREWEASGFDAFEFVEGSQKTGSYKRWTIRELLTNKALVTEGRKMKHCVASYAESCAKGYCSIWALELHTFEGSVKAVTIEVRNQNRLICQVRGRRNRFPTDKEQQIIHRWAEQAQLVVASYV